MRKKTLAAIDKLQKLESEYQQKVKQYIVDTLEKGISFAQRQEEFPEMREIEFAADEILGISAGLTFMLDIMNPALVDDIACVNKLIEIFDEWGNQVLEENRAAGFDRHKNPETSQLPKED